MYSFSLHGSVIKIYNELCIDIFLKVLNLCPPNAPAEAGGVTGEAAYHYSGDPVAIDASALQGWEL